MIYVSMFLAAWITIQLHARCWEFPCWRLLVALWVGNCWVVIFTQQKCMEVLALRVGATVATPQTTNLLSGIRGGE